MGCMYITMDECSMETRVGAADGARESCARSLPDRLWVDDEGYRTAPLGAHEMHDEGCRPRYVSG